MMGMPRIVPNPYDNTLIVQSTPEQWESIRSLLDKLDVSPRQVLIDAKIYEVDLTGSFSAGVEAFLQQKGTTNAAGITTTQINGSNNSGFNASTLLSAGTLGGAEPATARAASAAGIEIEDQDFVRSQRDRHRQHTGVDHSG